MKSKQPTNPSCPDFKAAINPVHLSSPIISQRGGDKSNLKQIKCSPRPSRIEKKLLPVNFNVRSPRLIATNQLDVCRVTETWLVENDCVIRKGIYQGGLISKIIKGQTDGDVALVCYVGMICVRKNFGGTSSFEYSKYAVRFDVKKCFIHVLFRLP